MAPKAQSHSQALEDRATTFQWTNKAISIIIDQWLDATRQGERVDNGGFKPVVSTRIFNEFKAQGLPVPSAIQLKTKKAAVSIKIYINLFS